MSKYSLLLKMQLYSFLGINHMLHSHDQKEKKRSLLLGLSSILIICIGIIYSSLLCKGLADLGMVNVLPTFTILICSSITLLMTFMKSTGVLIGLRDYDLVMSLPVSNVSIVSSRITMVYLMNLAICLIVGIPSVVIYSLYTRPAISIYFMFIFVLFLTPIIPMILSLVIGILITAISLRSRHRNIISLLLNIIAVLVIVVLPLQIQKMNMDDAQLANFGAMIAETTNRIYPPAGMLSSAILNNDWWHFLMFAILSLIVGIGFTASIARFYKKLNTEVFSHHAQGKYKSNELKTLTPFMAMYKREFVRFFSCTIYAINSSIGMILLLIAAVSLQFVSVDYLNSIIGLTFIKPLLPMTFAFLITLSSTTAVSLSLEGKNRWIMCSIPVNSIQIFNAKIAVNLTVICPIAFISAILVGFAIRPTGLEFILFFVVSVSYALFISVLGMFLNAKFPKYDWTSEYNAVKGGSISLLATLGIGMASSIIPMFVCMVLSSISWLVMIVASVSVLFTAFVLYGKLKKFSLYI